MDKAGKSLARDHGTLTDPSPLKACEWANLEVTEPCPESASTVSSPDPQDIAVVFYLFFF